MAIYEAFKLSTSMCLLRNSTKIEKALGIVKYIVNKSGAWGMKII